MTATAGINQVTMVDQITEQQRPADVAGPEGGGTSADKAAASQAFKLRPKGREEALDRGFAADRPRVVAL